MIARTFLQVAFLNLLLVSFGKSCNEAVCGSVVSKCLLISSCKCETDDRACHKECYSCLGDVFSECCPCVEMCPKRKDEISDSGTSLSKKSHVEEFPDKVAELFRILTEHPDPLERWTSFTYPIDLDAAFFASKKELKLRMKTNEQEIVVPKKGMIDGVLNCTVAFMSKCTSWTKCRNSCLSMGASSYRWFHDGCCECIGDTCVNYGINESRCKMCSLRDKISYNAEEDENYEIESDDEWE